MKYQPQTLNRLFLFATLLSLMAFSSACATARSSEKARDLRFVTGHDAEGCASLGKVEVRTVFVLGTGKTMSQVKAQSIILGANAIQIIFADEDAWGSTVRAKALKCPS